MSPSEKSEGPNFPLICVFQSLETQISKLQGSNMPTEDFIKQLVNQVPWLGGVVGFLVILKYGYEWVLKPILADRRAARLADEVAAAERTLKELEKQRQIEDLKVQGHIQMDRMVNTMRDAVREFIVERADQQREAREVNAKVLDALRTRKDGE